MLPLPPIHRHPHATQPLTPQALPDTIFLLRRVIRCPARRAVDLTVAASTPAPAVASVLLRGRVAVRVDVFAVDILRFRDEGAAAVAPPCVALLEAEELDLLVKEVD